jgi:hypothetical protein
MPSNRQARINRLKAAFQKAEELMNDGYIVQWDGEVVEKVIFNDDSLMLETNFENFIHLNTIYDNRNSTDYADMKIAEINKELAERLTVWKKVEIKL